MKEWKKAIIDNTWERLYISVGMLASGQESIQVRLFWALMHLAPLQVRDFPEELQEAFKEIRDEMARVGSIEASTRAMNDEQASKVAKKIVHLYDAIARDYCLPYSLQRSS